MSEWKKVKIGDICKIVKGTTGIASAEPGQYPLVVTAEERKTCSTYQFDCEAVCIPLVSSSGHGKKSLKNVHYQSGKFALGTILCAVIPNNPQELDARYLHQYLQFYKDIVLVPLMKGAANVSLSMKDIANVEFPLPPIERQKELADLFITLQENQKKLAAESEKQLEYTKQLRQNILQDAIEGKLTADWRAQHPVIKGNPDYDSEALFEKIQKGEVSPSLQPAKPSSATPSAVDTPATPPFEIPEGWKFVKLGEICEGFMYGTSNKSVSSGKCPVLRMGNIQNGKIDWEKLVYTNDSEEIEKYKLKKFDLLFNRTNSREMVGKTAIFESDENTIYAGYLVRFHPIISNSYFINFILNSKTHREWCNAVKTDALGQSNINAEKLKNFIAPLPPLKEQEEIVNKVESLLAKATELENQIQERKILSEKLAFGIIKEKLEGNNENERHRFF